MVLCRYILKSLLLWETIFDDPVMFKEKQQKFHSDREGESVGQHQVDKEDTLTASAAASGVWGYVILFVYTWFQHWQCVY